MLHKYHFLFFSKRTSTMIKSIKLASIDLRKGLCRGSKISNDFFSLLLAMFYNYVVKYLSNQYEINTSFSDGRKKILEKKDCLFCEEK